MRGLELLSALACWFVRCSPRTSAGGERVSAPLAPGRTADSCGSARPAVASADSMRHVTWRAFPARANWQYRNQGRTHSRWLTSLR